MCGVTSSGSRFEATRLGALVRIRPATEPPAVEAGVPIPGDPLWKRPLDIAAAGLLLLVSLPLWLIIALLIKLTSPGPVFYVQAPVGRGGRTFRYYKFRSRRAGADRKARGGAIS
jgi:lipopolysaccharide/colanic/teichoic acid biosynthesis glycosyltransferase